MRLVGYALFECMLPCVPSKEDFDEWTTRYNADLMLPKRICWKAEPAFQTAFSKHFLRL
jgi:hypothetical protein